MPDLELDAGPPLTGFVGKFFSITIDLIVGLYLNFIPNSFAALTKASSSGDCAEYTS